MYGQYPLPLTGANTDRTDDLNGFGFYIQDQIDLNEKWQVRLGLRWDDFEQKQTDRLRSTRTRASDDRVSPQFGVVYRLNEGISLYASYGEGYRQQPGGDFQGNQFDPNITESAEVGLKIDFGEFYEGVSGVADRGVL